MEDIVDRNNDIIMIMDPSRALPWEIFSMIISWLEIKDLYACMLVCSTWNEAANENCIWDYLCKKLWCNKVYIPKVFKEMRKNKHAKEAYNLSIKDSTREVITREELISFNWSVRFRSNQHVIGIKDRWSKGKKATVIRFNDDGSNSVVGKRWKSLEKIGMRVDQRKWRFRSGSNTEGAEVQVNSYPSYSISRYKNWGFVMQSIYVVFTSFEMPLKGVCPELEDVHLNHFMAQREIREISSKGSTTSNILKLFNM